MTQPITPVNVVRLSVIVPVYNEERTIGEVIERIRAVDLPGIDKEIIVANDGSNDGTLRANDQGAWRQDSRLVVVESPINLDTGAAIRLGLKHATGSIVLNQDADLELAPNEYGNLLAPILNQGAAVVDGLDVAYVLPRCRLTRGRSSVPIRRHANGAVHAGHVSRHEHRAVRRLAIPRPRSTASIRPVPP